MCLHSKKLPLQNLLRLYLVKLVNMDNKTRDQMVDRMADLTRIRMEDQLRNGMVGLTADQMEDQMDHP
jgi:hypothetical protein